MWHFGSPTSSDMSNQALLCTQDSSRDVAACHTASPHMMWDFDEDPIWSADWTQLEMPALQYMPRAVEVFALHDQQTWLARLRARRDRAERALNQKLVRRINRKLEAASVDTPRDAAEVSQGIPGAIEACLEEVEDLNRDIWGLDWTALSPCRRSASCSDW